MIILIPEMMQYLDSKHPEISKEILSSGKIDDQLKSKLEKSLKDFEATFSA